MTSTKIHKYISSLSLYDQLTEVCLPESESTAMSRTKINNFYNKKKISQFLSSCSDINIRIFTYSRFPGTIPHLYQTDLSFISQYLLVTLN